MKLRKWDYGRVKSCARTDILAEECRHLKPTLGSIDQPTPGAEARGFLMASREAGLTQVSAQLMGANLGHPATRQRIWTLNIRHLPKLICFLETLRSAEKKQILALPVDLSSVMQSSQYKVGLAESPSPRFRI